MAVEFRLLGEVEVRVDGRAVAVGHARQRGVLVALLIEANRPVPADQLLDRVWTDRLPQRARNALSGYVSRLRQVLPTGGPATIARQPGGYRLTVDPMAVDLHRFHHLLGLARAAADEDEAVALFEQALGLWRGEPFGALETPWLSTVRSSLEAQRLGAELDRNDLALRRGRHAALEGELAEMATAHPENERLAGQLMLAQYRCGRQAEALHHYERLRRRLAEELGADPSPPLRRLHQQILTSDPVLMLTPASAAAAVPAWTSTPVPRQLPAPPRSFIGRAGELAALDALLDPGPRNASTTVVVSAVSGTAGVGKTALAVFWAHRVAERFEDGQLYVNLRGFDPSGSVMSASEAVRGFLDALGVAPERVPSTLDAQVGLYRSLVAGRRMLVVLDNARDAEHVRPLLPGTPGCLVVVTSRNELTGLLASDGAHPITLELLTSAEAHDLLAHRLGRGRLAAEPAAAAEIISRCARLPLALTIVTARAATHPGFPLAVFAEELRNTGTALDALADTDPRMNVRAVFSWSFHTLSDPAARLFQLLGLQPGPDVAAPAAASLAALPTAHARTVLAELAGAHLMAEDRPGRFTLHDLLRAYAIEQAHAHDPEAERAEATHRVLDHYLHSAHTAAGSLHRVHDPIAVAPPQPGVTPEAPFDHDGAMAWFAAEHQVLLAVIQQAARTGFHSHVWQLAWTLTTFLDRRGHWHDWVTTGLAALVATRRLADPFEQARAHRSLARAYTRLDRLDEAHVHLGQALELDGDLIDDAGAGPAGPAETRLRLSQVLERQGRYAEALDNAVASLTLFRAAGQRVGQAIALNAVGWCHAHLGDHHRALERCRRALALLRRFGDRVGEADTLDSLGYAHHHLGHHRQAITSYRRATHLYRVLGDRYDEAATLTRLGNTYHAVGDTDAASATWHRALTIFDELDHPDAERVRTKLGLVALTGVETLQPQP
jgi:DNA-binding SARP family transcriptional activator